MTVNPLGFVVLQDGESPRTFTGKARTDISEGDLVVVSGAATNLSSGASSYTTSDVVVDIIHDSNYCNGVAINTVSSGGNVTVAMRGTVIGRSAGVISGGDPLIPVSGTTQGFGRFTVGSATVSSLAGTCVGRARTAAASGTNIYFVVDLNL